MSGRGVRIVGGLWRGRRLTVPEAPGLRPTPDRVRETLFNWLMPLIPGARVLDLFAGSGVLGLEAASRGAGEVVLVERNRHLAHQLEELRQRLQAGKVSVHCRDALRFLEAEATPFDIVFVDPPYASGLLEPACRALTGGWLAPGAMVYLETPVHRPPPQLPGEWCRYREKRAGQVRYALWQAGETP